MMQFDLFKQGAQLAAPPRVGASDKNRRAHRAAVEVAIKYGNDATKIYGVRHASKDLSGGELSRKRGGAVGMMEGWREVLNEPVRQRNGLLQMSAHYNV